MTTMTDTADWTVAELKDYCKHRVLEAARQAGRDAFAASETGIMSLTDWPAWLASQRGQRVGDFTKPRNAFLEGWEEAKAGA